MRLTGADCKNADLLSLVLLAKLLSVSKALLYNPVINNHIVLFGLPEPKLMPLVYSSYIQITELSIQFSEKNPQWFFWKTTKFNTYCLQSSEDSSNHLDVNIFNLLNQKIWVLTCWLCLLFLSPNKDCSWKWHICLLNL